MIEQSPVRRSLSVVELVDYDDVEMIWLYPGKPLVGKGLDAGEYVAPLVGFLPVYQQLTKGRVGKHLLIHPSRLLQNLLAVRDEQECLVTTMDIANESPVVQCRNNSLAGPRRCDDEVSVPVVNRTFSIELLKDLGLKWLGMHF